MKFAIQSIAYHEERFIKHFVRHYRSLVDEILVLNTSVSYQGDVEDYDSTGDIAKGEGARVVKEYWKTEHEQRNFGLEKQSHFDWVFILDPDEFIEKDEFERFKVWLETVGQDAYRAKQTTYWKNGYTISADRYMPITVCKPKRVKFTDKRCTDSEVIDAPFKAHHLSWARTDEEILRKVTHFSHAGEFNGVEWFENVWKKWHPEYQGLHPIDPMRWALATKCEVPEELKHLWREL